MIDLSSSIMGVLDELSQGVASGLIVLRMPDGSLSVTGDPLAALRPLRRDGDRHASIRSIILSACERSESIGMGSTKLLIDVLHNIMEHRRDGMDRAAIRRDIKSVIAGLPAIAERPSQAAIDECLERMVPDAARLVSEAIGLAGSECKIFVEPSTTGLTIVERVMGNTFTGSPDPIFLKNGKWHASDVRCLVVDGLIERVAEIDSLLQRCNEGRRPMVIFARGFSEDVLTTLRVNHSRKTLNVIPVAVEFDLETVNILLDIAMVLGCDVVSSLKGELISTVKFDSLPVARNVTCVGSAITVLSDEHASSEVHLKNLIQRRNAESLPAMRRILDKRIRSLSASSVVIRVTDVGTRGSKIMHDIDAGLKIVRSVLQHGVIRSKDVVGIPGASIIGKALDQDVMCPTLTLGSALHHALAVSESLGSAACYLGNHSAA